MLVIAVLGGPGSGKTTLCASLTGMEPDYNDHLPTEYTTKIKDGSLVVVFKELHLAEEFYDLNRGELKNSDGILGVFNTEELHSLEFIAPTLQKIQNDGLSNAKPIAMIAMNSKSPRREVPRKVGETTAKVLSLAYLEDCSPTLTSEILQLIQRVEPRDFSQVKRNRKTKPKEISRTLDKSKSVSLPPARKEDINKTSPRPATEKHTKKPLTFGKYEVVRIVGSGVEGRVYEAIDKETRLTVALKEMTNGNNTETQEKIMRYRQHFRAEFPRELDHPNIVKCYGTFTDTLTFKKFLVMEYMKDGSLLERIKTHPDLSQDEIVGILKQLAGALEYMEEKKVLHRDIALRNVLVKIESDGKWTVKMGDFGLARQPTYPDEVEYEMVTVFRPLPLNQIPPECTHTRKWNPKCEAWSFGVLIWELLSRGQTPYDGLEEEVFEFLEKGKRLNRPNKCPDKLWRLMNQCWHQEPEQRPSFTDISRLLTDSPYSWMPAVPKAAYRQSTSPYAEMPPISKPGKASSMEQMMEALSATNQALDLNWTMQRSTSTPNFTSEVPWETDVAVPKPRSPYGAIPFSTAPAQPAYIQSDPIYVTRDSVCGTNPMSVPDEPIYVAPASIYPVQPDPIYVTSDSIYGKEPVMIDAPIYGTVLEDPPAPQVSVASEPVAEPVSVPPEPAFVPVVEVAVPPPVQAPAPQIPTVSRPVSPVLTPPLPRPAEYSVWHDGAEHCAVETLTPDMTLEKARELLAQEVDFEIEKCNFFRTDTNQRVAFKQEKTFMVQKCTANTFAIHLRTTS